MKQRAIVWLRRDLRLADNPALAAASAHGRVIPVYIHAPDELAPWQTGGAQRVWLHLSLAALDASLRELGSRLIIRRGPTLETLRALIRESGADAVHWNRLYEPALIARDRRIKQSLHADGIEATSHNAALLCEPWQIQTQTGQPYKVFTPFWRTLSQRQIAAPLAAPERLTAVWSRIGSDSLDNLKLLPDIAWDAGIRAAWQPGEDGAHASLESFLADAVGDYGSGRDCPGQVNTSRLSPHLHFGEIGPRQVWHRVHEFLDQHSGRAPRDDASKFLSELAWREFAHHLLFHFPGTPDAPLDTRFKAFPWRHDQTALRTWQRGETGIPMVDAGMRELWQTGWMHNRVRMVVASFLTKNLRLPWQWGARWFWDTLVDADLANNTLGWQWVAGCGADAAPYFRIFNPVRQGERFDPQGDYVRRWIPDLAKLPDKYVHAPWTASTAVRGQANLELGVDYPHPQVDLKQSRRDALDAFALIKKTSK